VYRYHWHPSSPRPIAVKGKERKKFGETWWGKKWINGVESIGDDKRMSRGRAYARAEKVYDIKLSSGKIAAKVEGNSGNYSIHINFQKYSNKEWDRILSKIRSNPAIFGRMINNELPENLDNVCSCKLLPENMEAECSCPDYENPCKHIAALYYTLADEIDCAPQILFLLRGLEFEKLKSALLSEDVGLEKKIKTTRRIAKRRIQKKNISTQATFLERELNKRNETMKKGLRRKKVLLKKRKGK